jgi:predicted transglutaminase-like cysteine proteinase
MKQAATIVALVLMITQAGAAEPFGIATMEPTHDRALTALWHNLRVDIARDEFLIALCRADSACGSDSAIRLIAIVDAAKTFQGRAMIGHLNQAINKAILPAHSIVPWYAPLTALSHPGDCKSYAVTKDVALGEAGIPEADRRLIMVRDYARPNETHLVVVVRDGEGWLVLDNRTLILADSTAVRYQPLHQFDEDGVRDFPAPPPVGGPGC